MSRVLGLIISFLVSAFVYLVHGNDVLDIKMNKYTCPQTCGSSGSSTMWMGGVQPVTLSVRSRLECASACSKLPWCIRYVFGVQKSVLTFSTASPSPKCFLYGYDDSLCPSSSGFMAGSVSCKRMISSTLSRLEQCQLSSQQVLLANNSNVSFLIDYAYLLNLCASANDLRVKFVFDTSSFVTAVNYYTLGTNIPGKITLAALDFMTNIGMNSFPLIVRSVSSDSTSTNNRMYNTGILSTPRKPLAFSWYVQKRSTGNLGNFRKVFTTGEDTSGLYSALQAGYSFKLLLHGSNRVVVADIIGITDPDLIIAQATYYDNGEQKTLSLPTKGASEQLSWNLDTNTDKVVTLSNFGVTWMADSCWTQAATFSGLKSALTSGRKIRVKFKSDNIPMYSTPIYIGLQNNDEIVAHITAAIGEAAILSLTSIINLGQKAQWKHFIVSSTGNVMRIPVDVGSSDVGTSSTESTPVQWFVDTQKYMLIHESLPSGTSSLNTTSLKLLVDAVHKGSDVRVHVQVVGNKDRLHYFTCDALQIPSGDQEVNCQVNGLLAVGFFEDSISTTGTTTAGLGGLIQGLLGGSSEPSDPYTHPSSGCPQYLIFSTSGSVKSYISCLHRSSLEQTPVSKSAYIDWFIPG